MRKKIAGFFMALFALMICWPLPAMAAELIEVQLLTEEESETTVEKSIAIKVSNGAVRENTYTLSLELEATSDDSQMDFDFAFTPDIAKIAKVHPSEDGKKIALYLSDEVSLFKGGDTVVIGTAKATGKNVEIEVVENSLKTVSDGKEQSLQGNVADDEEEESKPDGGTDDGNNGSGGSDHGNGGAGSGNSDNGNNDSGSSDNGSHGSGSSGSGAGSGAIDSAGSGSNAENTKPEESMEVTETAEVPGTDGILDGSGSDAAVPDSQDSTAAGSTDSSRDGGNVSKAQTLADELKQTITFAETYHEEDYSKESFAALQAALKAAREAADKQDVTEEELEAARIELENAIGALVGWQFSDEESTEALQAEETMMPSAEGGETQQKEDKSTDIGSIALWTAIVIVLAAGVGAIGFAVYHLQQTRRK